MNTSRFVLNATFGRPCTDTDGNHTAVWPGDKIERLKRSGQRWLCRVSWGLDVSGNPHEFVAWLHKRIVRQAHDFQVFIVHTSKAAK